MKYETIPNLTLPKIGFGTWKIGGGPSPDPTTDSASMTALRSALEVGYTHFDTAEMYADGHAEELLGKAIRSSQVKREALFITSKVTPSHLQYDQVLHSCENSLRRLQMDYIGSVSHPLAFGGNETWRYVSRVEQTGARWKGETSWREQFQFEIIEAIAGTF